MSNNLIGKEILKVLLTSNVVMYYTNSNFYDV